MSESFEKPKISWEVLQSEVEVFSPKLTTSLEELGILEECKSLEIDHICVRLKNHSDVDNLKAESTKFGQIISSVEVNGREISIIQLSEPLKLGHWQTFGVELPYPKQNHSYVDGWEHVEFVLNDAENTMAGVRHAFQERFNLGLDPLKTKYSYSEDEPHAEGDQLPNPTIGLKVNGVGIKFHARPIQEVVGFMT
jgi:predicted metalloenzyme YecM